TDHWFTGLVLGVRDLAESRSHAGQRIKGCDALHRRRLGRALIRVAADQRQIASLIAAHRAVSGQVIPPPSLRMPLAARPLTATQPRAPHTTGAKLWCGSRGVTGGVGPRAVAGDAPHAPDLFDGMPADIGNDRVQGLPVGVDVRDDRDPHASTL